MQGKISWFGGPTDKGMLHTEGLSFYEHAEANYRPDLFYPRSDDLTEGVSKRLRCEVVPYIALNVPLNVPRINAQRSRWKLTNLSTGESVECHLVDRGPSAAGRLVDASRAALWRIGLSPDSATDKLVDVEEVSAFSIPFGLYEAMQKV